MSSIFEMKLGIVNPWEILKIFHRFNIFFLLNMCRSIVGFHVIVLWVLYSLFGDSENRENNYLKIRDLLSIALFNILGTHYLIHTWEKIVKEIIQIIKKISIGPNTNFYQIVSKGGCHYNEQHYLFFPVCCYANFSHMGMSY